MALGEVVKIVGGGTPSRDRAEYYGGGIPWVTPKDMKTWEIAGAQETLTAAGVSNSATRLVPPNSVLVVVRSGVLKHTLPVGINRVEVAINQDLKALLCNGKVVPDYLARFLKASSARILAMVRATTADNFPIDVLRGLPVPLPPEAEQRRIATVLDCTEALMVKRRSALECINDLVWAAFYDLFGDPAANRRGWPVVSLGDLIAEGPQNGLYKPASEYGSGTPILRIDAFYDGVVTDLRALKRVAVSDSERDAFSLRPDDIVVNRVNSLEYLGKCALVPPLPEPVIFESNMMRFRIRNERLRPRFLSQFLQTDFVRAQIGRRAKKAVNQASINQRDVCGLCINVPPLDVQDEFVLRTARIAAHAARATASLDVTRDLLAAVQDRAFAGAL